MLNDNFNTKRTIEQIEESVLNAIQLNMFEAQDLAREYVPLDTGVLKLSIKAKQGMKKGYFYLSLSSNVKYATYQEFTELRHLKDYGHKRGMSRYGEMVHRGKLPIKGHTINIKNKNWKSSIRQSTKYNYGYQFALESGIMTGKEKAFYLTKAILKVKPKIIQDIKRLL